jgi:hypothetical protein
MNAEIKDIPSLRKAASDGDSYTDKQIMSLMVDQLRKKAHRRGLVSGVLVGSFITGFIAWALLCK